MRVPGRLRDVDQGVVSREYGTDHTAGIAVDFGPETDDISVDTVDGTAIVVANGEQFEFELPEEADDASTNNGVLTIEG